MLFPVVVGLRDSKDDSSSENKCECRPAIIVCTGIIQLAYICSACAKEASRTNIRRKKQVKPDEGAAQKIAALEKFSAESAK